ncbi:MAG: alcohol dehydrogenase catalytic domain-containing protein [Clostridia bacterium]|nr:alcohol dehydrogenase catalytic domain-containing protein [Clostridia bacterium]
MKIWHLTSPHHIERATAPDLKIADGAAKIKITKAFLSETDLSVFTGAIKVKAPFIPGRFAIGQVTEAGTDSFMQKGDRVYLADVMENDGDDLKIAGATVDGFYRDFVLAGANDCYVLPPSVSDEAAFLIDAVAMAERVVDELHVSVGQHVLVLGGGLYGNVLCQILIYHRAVPLLIDSNDDRLALAKKSGIYYTFKNDETLKDNVLKATGGKLADAAVYLAMNNRTEASSLFSLLARNAYVAFYSNSNKTLPVNLQNAIKNGVTIKCLCENSEFISTAINVLANKAVEFSQFPIFMHSEEELPTVLEAQATLAESGAIMPIGLHAFKFVF